MERRSTNWGGLGNANVMVSKLVRNEAGLIRDFGGWKERERRWAKDGNVYSAKCAGSKFTFLDKLCVTLMGQMRCKMKE